MDRSVAQGGRTDPARDLDADRVARAVWLAAGVALAIVAFAVYSITRIDRYYDHFVWQAAAFLEGQAAIRYPVGSDTLGIGNWFFVVGRRRLVLAATAAILLVSMANLMHFSQGWVQFGYRFSNDIVPFALVLVALGIDRLGTTDRPAPRSALPLAMGLIVASIAINAWGVAWGRALGW